MTLPTVPTEVERNAEQTAKYLPFCETCYILGRPLQARWAHRVRQIEDHATTIIGISAKELSAGRSVVVSADSESEPCLFQTLAIVSSRLRRKGLPVGFSDLTSATRELSYSKGISLVVDAPLRRLDRRWTNPPRGCVSVLAGFSKDWCALGVVPDLAFTSSESTSVNVSRFWELFQGGSDSLRLLLLAAAAGCDLPAALLDTQASNIAQPVLDSTGNQTQLRSIAGCFEAAACFEVLLGQHRFENSIIETLHYASRVLGRESELALRFWHGLKLRLTSVAGPIILESVRLSLYE